MRRKQREKEKEKVSRLSVAAHLGNIHESQTSISSKKNTHVLKIQMARLVCHAACRDTSRLLYRIKNGNQKKF